MSQHNSTHRRQQKASVAGLAAPRRGSVLLMVLVVVVLLSLGAYTFSELMLVEAESTAAYGKQVEARTFADSGVEYVAGLLGDKGDRNPAALYHNPGVFQGINMRQGLGAKGVGRFSVVAPVEADTSSQAVRFGLIDESAKLNLNMLTRINLDEAQQQLLLLNLPEMTEEIADAMLDWLDQDDNMRQFGAESDYYLGMSPPYEAKNGPIDSLDELLKVAGVTPWLLFGEDANRNGLLDPNENDGDLHPPFDNQDGYLQHGWSAFLTVNSRETNRRLNGKKKININQAALSTLYDAIAKELDEDTAAFIVAYRIAGTQSGTNTNSNNNQNNSGNNNQNSSGNNSQGGGNNNNSGGNNNNSGGSNNNSNTLQQAASAVGSAAAAASGGQVTRGGIDLTQGGQVNLKSLYELIGATARVPVNGVTTTLTSPWPDDQSQISSYIPTLMDMFTINNQEFIEGRVNISEARREVLMGVPGMVEELADAIVASQSMGDSLDGSDRTSTAWLYADGLVDLQTLRSLDPYITSRGDVFRMQVIGYFDGGGPAARIEAIIDSTQTPPQIVFIRDLTDLGRGYSPRLLINSQ